MAPPSPPPAAAAAKPQAPTTIRDLSDDLLREIFLRLPSLPSLVRAALACRTFLAAVRSSPAFRRQFRGLHPPPLLGLFFEPDREEMPTFTPLRRPFDPDHAAAVRGADVFLTRLPADDDGAARWQILECRGGRLLLSNWTTDRMAVYNPLTGALDLVPAPPEQKMRHNGGGKFIRMDSFLLYSDEAPASFRVVCCCHDKSRVRAAVFSSATKKWQVLPWSAPCPAQPAPNKYWLRGGTQVDGSLYWPHDKHAYKVVLDTATMEFSIIDLPWELKGQGHIYMAGETKDGKPCIVGSIHFTLFVWFRRANADGVEKWMLEDVIPMEAEVLQATGGSRVGHEGIEVLSILDGIVYLSTFERFRYDARLPCCYLTFSLDTRMLEKLFQTKSDGHDYPYIMAWPPSLIGINASH